MQVVRRLSGLDLDLVADAGVTTAGVGLTAFAMATPWGAAVIGPVWLRAVLPLVFGGPLVLRRRAPVVMWAGIWAAIALQYGVTGHQPESLELFVPIAGAYSLGALVSPRRSAVCLAASMVMAVPARPGLSILAVLAAWLVGVFVRPGAGPRRWRPRTPHCKARPSTRPKPSAPGSHGNFTTLSPTT